MCTLCNITARRPFGEAFAMHFLENSNILAALHLLAAGWETHPHRISHDQTPIEPKQQKHQQYISTETHRLNNQISYRNPTQWHQHKKRVRRGLSRGKVERMQLKREELI